MLKLVFNKLSQWLLPEHCILCNQMTKRDLSLCKDCEADLPIIKNACQQCARLLVDIKTDTALCGQCLIHPPFFDKTMASFAYQPPVSKIITDLKFHGNLVNAKVMGYLLLQNLKPHYESLPEIIIPVPLHKIRLKERGFNQALEIARLIAKLLNIPLYTDIIRINNTPPQTGMNAKERKRNIKNAYKITKPIRCKHALIIDDVMTTGSTVNELAKLLKRNGVERVDVGCCARAVQL